ncbi:MAG: hypothetical protein ACOVP5_03050, partial [Chitinophagales bacterium]
MQLFNRVDKRILKEQVLNSNEEYTTISFYKYHHIDNPTQIIDELFRAWYPMGVLVRIYID